jgi:hypothetical protein
MRRCEQMAGAEKIDLALVKRDCGKTCGAVSDNVQSAVIVKSGVHNRTECRIATSAALIAASLVYMPHHR